MNKKFEITDETLRYGSDTILHRIVAIKDFTTAGINIKKGDFGGYIENEENLSQEGSCWIFPDAKAFGNSKVYENAVIFDYSSSYDDCKIHGTAQISGNSEIYDDADICGPSIVNNSIIYSDALINSYVESACIGWAAQVITLSDYIHIFIDGISMTFYKTYYGSINVSYYIPLDAPEPESSSLRHFIDLIIDKYPEKYDYMINIINLVKEKLS